MGDVLVLALVLVLLLVMAVTLLIAQALAVALEIALELALVLANSAMSLDCCVGDTGVTNDSIASLNAVAVDSHRNPVTPESSITWA